MRTGGGRNIITRRKTEMLLEVVAGECQVEEQTEEWVGDDEGGGRGGRLGGGA